MVFGVGVRCALGRFAALAFGRRLADRGRLGRFERAGPGRGRECAHRHFGFDRIGRRRRGHDLLDDPAGGDGAAGSSVSSVARRVVRWIQPSAPTGVRTLTQAPWRLGDLDLVVGLELADLCSADLVGDVGHRHEVVADAAALEARRGAAGEGQRGDRRRRDPRARVARRLERRPSPAGHQRLAERLVEGGTGGRRDCGRRRREARRECRLDRRGGHLGRLGLLLLHRAWRRHLGGRAGSGPCRRAAGSTQSAMAGSGRLRRRRVRKNQKATDDRLRTG